MSQPTKANDICSLSMETSLVYKVHDGNRHNFRTKMKRVTLEEQTEDRQRTARGSRSKKYFQKIFCKIHKYNFLLCILRFLLLQKWQTFVKAEAVFRRKFMRVVVGDSQFNSNLQHFCLQNGTVKGTHGSSEKSSKVVVAATERFEAQVLGKQARLGCWKTSTSQRQFRAPNVSCVQQGDGERPPRVKFPLSPHTAARSPFHSCLPIAMALFCCFQLLC